MRSKSRKKLLIRDCYEHGECPDCGAEIPEEAFDGSECDVCGHVFFYSKKCDDGTCPDCYGASNKCICAPKVKGR